MIFGLNHDTDTEGPDSIQISFFVTENIAALLACSLGCKYKSAVLTF